MRGVRHLLALGTAAVCGVLLSCLRLRFPNPLTEALGPANASPWETGKLVFWAMLPAAAVLRRLEGSGGAGLCAAILLGAGLGLALAAAGAAPAAAALLAAATALGVHALALGRLGGDALPWYGAVILLAVAYLLFSILPPTDGCSRSRPVCPPPLSPFDGNAGKKGPLHFLAGDLFVGMRYQGIVARRPSVL